MICVDGISVIVRAKVSCDWHISIWDQGMITDRIFRELLIHTTTKCWSDLSARQYPDSDFD